MLYNLTRVAQALHRAPELMSTFFGHSLSMSVRKAEPSAGLHAWVLGGPVAPARLSQLLQDFITDWVLCKACGLPECALSVLPMHDRSTTAEGSAVEKIDKNESAAVKRKQKQRISKQTRSMPSSDGDLTCGSARAVWFTCAACGHHCQISDAIAARQPKLVKMLLSRPEELCTHSHTILNRSVGAGATGLRVGEATALADTARVRRPNGVPVVMQLRTEGAFISHCRQLGRLLAIESGAVGDPRAQAVQLPLLPELLVAVFVKLDSESLYRCMQTCVGWHCQARLAIADQRLLRHMERHDKLLGSDASDSSSDQSITTSSDSSDDEDGVTNE
eukprot:SAG31_NODE_1561_length_7872_cov_2.787469_8_plen_333_part_00